MAVIAAAMSAGSESAARIRARPYCFDPVGVGALLAPLRQAQQRNGMGQRGHDGAQAAMADGQGRVGQYRRVNRQVFQVRTPGARPGGEVLST
jgi:hypothetical protein